jgi:hypothetical protein
MKLPMRDYQLMISNYMLGGLKIGNEWLKNVNSESLEQANKNMEPAFTKFFREKNRISKV